VLRNHRRTVASAVAAAAVAASVVGAGLADSTPIGPLPSGPTSTIQTQKGHVVQEVTEADVGASVVLVFKATGSGKTTVSFALTRGETAKAYESRRFVVIVR
jgi:hypothetical protein